MHPTALPALLAMLLRTSWRTLLATAAFVTVLNQLSAQQVLYITESTYGRVLAYDLSTLQPYRPTSALGTTTGLGYYLQAIATDAAGNVYLAYPYNGQTEIRKFDNSGAIVTSFGTNGVAYTPGNNIISAAALDPANGRLVLPFNANTDAVQAFNTGNGALASGFTTLSGLTQLAGAAFNSSGSYLYVSRSSGGYQGSTITRYAPTGGAGTAITFTSGGYQNNGFDNARGLFFQSDTSMIVVSSSLGAVERYTLSGTVAILDTSFGTNGGVTITGGLTGGITADAAGNLYIVAGTRIVQLSANGALLNNAFLSGLNYTPQGLAIGAAFVPVPEPGSLALLGAGLALLGLGALTRMRVVGRDR